MDVGAGFNGKEVAGADLVAAVQDGLLTVNGPVGHVRMLGNLVRVKLLSAEKKANPVLDEIKAAIGGAGGGEPDKGAGAGGPPMGLF